MPSRRAITYPFVPRSAAFLLPGQFWALPLSDGSFGCGRVIEAGAPKGIGSRVSFIAGVLDWHANVPPTYETIAGATCLDQGSAHIKPSQKLAGVFWVTVRWNWTTSSLGNFEELNFTKTA